MVAREEDVYFLDYDRPDSIGKVRSFFGNTGVLLRAYTYIMLMGGDGLRKAAELSVLNSNYLAHRLRDHYPMPYGRLRKHEFVLSGSTLKERGLRTLDVAKRLIDHGFHPPTVYFPLIVDEALMIEPTETESKRDLDAFADALIGIAEEARTDPQALHDAPLRASVRRVDEVYGARNPVYSWQDLGSD
jgi:glycine dehydrogenase subunit 2